MIDSKHIDSATRMLVEILKAQPSLLIPISVTKDGGEELSGFMTSFIRRYSEHLQEMSNDPSR